MICALILLSLLSDSTATVQIFFEKRTGVNSQSITKLQASNEGDCDTINVSSNKRKYKFTLHHDDDNDEDDDEFADCEFVDVDIYAIIKPPSDSISESLSSETVSASDDTEMMLNLLIQAFSCLSIKYDDIIDEDTEMSVAEPLDEDTEMTEAEPLEVDDVKMTKATVFQLSIISTNFAVVC
ncbi:hypothetical protein MFLAVUS_005434 [Mucor flavus]|uniref:Uncharacterized protein n=1 Tax=Mucor flavus TaxID=439312 RepID=A0ABP9YYQ4_9FUNG